MKLLPHILLCLGMSIAFSISADNYYTTLATKADRFFYQYKEWSSALTMYELMIEQKPEVIKPYSNGIVAASMCDKSDSRMALLEKASDNAIPYDSLFTRVYKTSIELGKPEIYVDFLKQAREKLSWMSRMINIRLLDFYIFRADADNIIETASVLLADSPDNIRFLNAMGDAYSEKGDFEESMNCYHKVIAIDPHNIKALLALGNYYYITAVSSDSAISAIDKKEAAKSAVDFLSRAAEISPSPHISSSLNQLYSDFSDSLR